MICDEVHNASAESITKITKYCKNAYQRVGLTGTLKLDKLHPLQVQSSFGPIKRVVSTKELQDKGLASKTNINILRLEYPPEDRQTVYDFKSSKIEMEFLINHPYRNKIIKNLAISLSGNSLFLFDRVEKHLDVIAEELNSMDVGNKKFFVIKGGVKNDERNDIKTAVEQGDDIIILASFGTMSTGVSIKKLHNLVICHPTKSIIRLLQSVGRMLRLHETKAIANIYDLFDDIVYQGNTNKSFEWGVERLRIYQSEQHPFTIKNIKVKEPYINTQNLL